MDASFAALRLAGLLREWLETPYFETRADWEQWVNEFRPRVERAVKDVEQHWCPRCGGCRISIYCCFTSCECDE